MSQTELRREMIATCLDMNRLGINQGTAGNLSQRVSGGFLITPSGMSYEALAPEDMVFMKLDGSVSSGQRTPSSEWRFHRDILSTRHDANQILHTHAMFSTTLACLGRDIPAFHYMIAMAGGDSIRCSPYATFGTQELSDHAIKALQDRRACLLGNHGMIVLGVDLKKTLALAVEVETLAAQYWRALQIGKPNILNAEEMVRVIEKFKSYGVQRGGEV